MEAHENYTRQHQDLRVENGVRYGDVVEGVDFAYAAKVTALDAATLASLAWAPPAPDSVRIECAVQPSTTLRWTRAASPDLLGYRIYWRRPEESNWTRSRWVGDVTEHTLENVIIDNYFFGVAAVDREGNESLTVSVGPLRCLATLEIQSALPATVRQSRPAKTSYTITSATSAFRSSSIPNIPPRRTRFS
jgi:hypothetical protein